ncbi:hydroxymethylglutaryl-CoA lyase [soil metagenome]
MKIIECPRDAMQGISTFIPTKLKIKYLNQLLKIGFDTLDVGSFVSPKTVPQMRDTSEVLEQLAWEMYDTKLLTIVANARGAREASLFSQISYLGFPLSVSETFQRKNTNKGITEAFEEVKNIHNICLKNGMALVCYLSMGFGNPYGDPYDEAFLTEYIDQLSKEGIEIFSLSDTIGSADPDSINRIYTSLKAAFPDLEIGVHLHSNPLLVKEKIEAAYQAGCRRFDSALKGLGGCPMATEVLVGNIPTEELIEVLEENQEFLNLDKDELEKALKISTEVFPEIVRTPYFSN